MTSAISADNYLESAMMTSAVMSLQSAVSYSTTSRWYLKLAIEKRCHLDKWIRQRFAFALRTSSRYISQGKPAGSYSSFFHPIASYSDPVSSTSRPTSGQPAAGISSQAGQPVASTSRPPADVPVASYSVSSRRLQCFAYPVDRKSRRKEAKGNNQTQ
ncbi:hypothetical protein F511_06571 [Dorcoceras hygrometricum]|uniref:Uncharacterized protein n=1 Tax=Dorcoceras hygrometricum TaxID=472368 RepID=A0A2Z7CAR7_9LAMI|nr:hypothetical protein F511_06571 [Dorcoceras hygrometricum]